MIKGNVDLSGLGGLKNMDGVAVNTLQSAIRELAAQTHMHIVEEAHSKLHTRLKMFTDSLSYYQEDSNTWVVNLEADARWIDEGMCVVYGKSYKHQPKVLTPEGWLNITKVIPGTLVLNANNKWTKVIKIHDNDLFDFCVEKIDEKLTIERFGYSSTDFSKRSHKKIIVKCDNCQNIRETTKFSFSDTSIPHCEICQKSVELVSIKIGRQNFERNLILTYEHPILTQRGWIKANELTKEDFVYAPAWGNCKFCDKKVLFGGDYCNSKCFLSFFHKKKMSQGTHVSQHPEMGENKVSKFETQILPSVLANHFGEIEHIPIHPLKIKKIKGGKYSCFSRRWDITVEEGESFVCQGIVIHNSPHNMVQKLLASKAAKTSKDGSKYLSVPFKHNKGPTQQTPQQQLLLSTIKQALKENKISFSKPELDVQGNVKTGLVRTLDITSGPLKTSHSPGQGKGKIGLVRQGFSQDGVSGTPFLKNLQIYQRQIQTTTGKTKTTKDFMTFRTVSSKHALPEVGKGGQLKLMATGDARWDHPGLEPTNLMQDGMDWAISQLTKNIVPQILDKIKISM